MSRNMLTLMDQLFDDTFKPINSSLARITTSTAAINVSENDDSYIINVTIPGLDANKINIELEDHLLTISYDHEESNENESDSDDLIRQEYSHYSFSRSVALPKNIDSESVKASSSRGILKITVNKSPESKPRKINIDSQD